MMTNYKDSVNFFQRTYVLGFIHFPPLCGLSVESVLRNPRATQIRG